MVKGIIFVAKVLDPISEKEFRPEIAHDQIHWLSEDELSNYPEDITVNDFQNTLKKVFENFDSYFAEGGNPVARQFSP